MAETVAMAENAEENTTPQTFYLTPENTTFSVNEQSFLSCVIHGEAHHDVTIARALPFSMPDDFLTVLEKDKELGMIHHLSDFDEETREILRTQLEFRYFSPEITKIHSIEENVSFLFFKLETTSGSREICVTDIAKNVTLVDGDRVYITDVEENRFVIPSVAALDKSSRQKIEIYI